MKKWKINYLHIKQYRKFPVSFLERKIIFLTLVTGRFFPGPVTKTWLNRFFMFTEKIREYFPCNNDISIKKTLVDTFKAGYINYL